MAIYSYDIVSTLQALGMMKYWKGKHIVLKKQVSLQIIKNHLKIFIKCITTCRMCWMSMRSE